MKKNRKNDADFVLSLVFSGERFFLLKVLINGSYFGLFRQGVGWDKRGNMKHHTEIKQTSKNQSVRERRKFKVAVKSNWARNKKKKKKTMSQ